MTALIIEDDDLKMDRLRGFLTVEVPFLGVEVARSYKTGLRALTELNPTLVENQLVKNAIVPSSDSMLLAKGAGLFASANPVSRTAILEVLEPQLSVPVSDWTCRKRAGFIQRTLSWIRR